MTKRVELPVVSTTPKTLGRREVLGLMGAAGAGLALPAVAQDHPCAITSLTPTAWPPPTRARARPARKPVFLDAHQMETLTSLAERIVPAPTRAKVAPFIDQLLAVDTPGRSAEVHEARWGGSTPRPPPATTTRGRR